MAPRGPQKSKPFRDALRMEIAAAGEDHRALRAIARSLMVQAGTGDVTAIREIADRLDGKVPQAVGGDSEMDAVKMEISWSPAAPQSSIDE